MPVGGFRSGRHENASLPVGRASALAGNRRPDRALTASKKAREATMRLAISFAACALAGAIVVPACAETVQPLSYVQPLPQQSVQAVQDRLRQAGAYAGPVDGVWGPDSEAALERFQQAHQLQVTGQMNQATAATLSIDPASVGVVAASPPPPPTVPLAAGTPSLASVRAVQTRLQALNFYSGIVDGIWGASTQTAIERFQQGRGLQPNGQLNPATITALGLSPDAVSFR
jgi:peptidoglycan hydrolase-like protein with peptidoglycan-binding domain